MRTTSAGQPPGSAVRARRPVLVPLLVIAAAAVVVALLAWAVAADFAPVLRVDTAVSVDLYAGDNRSALVDTVLRVATAPGLFVVRMVLAVPVLVWLALRRAWWTAAFVLTAIGLIGPVTSLLKELVGRVRPQFAGGGAGYDSLSFPSGHASGIATLVTVALVLAWPLLGPAARWVWLAAGAALVLLVGFTRMWLGVHYLSDVVAGWALGVGWTLLLAVCFGALPGGRASLPERSSHAPGGPRKGGPTDDRNGAELVNSRVLLAPTDGSCGPLLRLADDRLPAETGYGRHAHADVDVVAVVLAGSLRHAWGREAVLGPGDVAVLRAGRGLEHDEVAGAGGAHVLQAYLRAAEPGGQPSHDVLLRPAGWVDLRRADARLWVGEAGPDVPSGLRVTVRDGEVSAAHGEGPVTGPARICVWQLDTVRPAWAE